MLKTSPAECAVCRAEYRTRSERPTVLCLKCRQRPVKRLSRQRKTGRDTHAPKKKPNLSTYLIETECFLCHRNYRTYINRPLILCKDCRENAAERAKDMQNGRGSGCVSPLKSIEDRPRRRCRGNTKEQRRRWKKKYPEKERRRHKKQNKRSRELLLDLYVKDLVHKKTGMSRSLVTREMIEIQREIIKIRRLQKQLYQMEANNG